MSAELNSIRCVMTSCRVYVVHFSGFPFNIISRCPFSWPFWGASWKHLGQCRLSHSLVWLAPGVLTGIGLMSCTSEAHDIKGLWPCRASCMCRLPAWGFGHGPLQLHRLCWWSSTGLEVCFWDGYRICCFSLSHCKKIRLWKRVLFSAHLGHAKRRITLAKKSQRKDYPLANKFDNSHQKWLKVGVKSEDP